MAKFTFKNGKIMPSDEAKNVGYEYTGKRKAQGQKAAEKPAAPNK